MTNNTTGGPADQPDAVPTPPSTALPAGFTLETCITVACRTCRGPYEDTEYGEVNFIDLESAARVITGAGWWVTQQGAQCGACSAAEACAAFGHAWPDWKLCRCSGRIPAHVAQMEVRSCASCGEQQERLAQASGERLASPDTQDWS
jgi:hypothetical protein